MISVSSPSEAAAKQFLEDYSYSPYVVRSTGTNKTVIETHPLGSVKLSHKELQRLTPAERTEYYRYRSKHAR